MVKILQAKIILKNLRRAIDEGTRRLKDLWIHVGASLN